MTLVTMFQIQTVILIMNLEMVIGYGWFGYDVLKVVGFIFTFQVGVEIATLSLSELSKSYSMEGKKQKKGV